MYDKSYFFLCLSILISYIGFKLMSINRQLKWYVMNVKSSSINRCIDRFFLSKDIEDNLWKAMEHCIEI